MSADSESDRWERIGELFDRAATLPAGERSAFLQKECAGDRALLEEIESLLRRPEDSKIGTFEWSPSEVLLGQSADPGLPVHRGQNIGPSRPDTVVGHYRLVRLLGRGGMGEVWLGERCDDEFHQQVAVKLVKRGMDTDEIIRRFRRERQLLASLHHPHIARLFDGGATGEGLPYLVMEYVEGEPIDAWCDARKLSIDDRLRLFAKVCDAVSAAHRSLIVHRDLKPPNILVTEDGTPKLLDFGIARLISADAESRTMLTAGGGGRMLTPRYASPEQIRDEPVTTATDVYSLGVILYELLTGRTPHEITTGSPRELEEAICRVEPRRPSTIVVRPPDDTTTLSSTDGPTTSHAIAAARGLDAAHLKRSLSGDLDVIILRALDKDPARRYVSAEQLAADIRLYLELRPIVARPDTLGYRTAKLMRRHSRVVGASAVGLVLILAALVTSVVMYVRETGLREEADHQTTIARATYEFLGSMLLDANPNYNPRGRSATIEEIVDRAVGRIEGALGAHPEVEGAVRRELGMAYLNMGRFDDGADQLTIALRVRSGVLPFDHADVLQCLNDLAQLEWMRGNNDAAEAHILETLARIERSDSISPLIVARVEGIMGAVHMVRGEHEANVRRLRHAIDLLRSRLVEPNRKIASTLHNLGVALWQSGDLEQAEATSRESLQMERALFGDRHVRVAATLSNVGGIVSERGRPEEAEPMLREALDVQEEMLGEDHWETGDTRSHLGHCLGRLAQVEEAQRHLRAARKILAAELGETHWRTQRAARRLEALIREPSPSD